MTQELSSLMDGELEPRDADRALRTCGLDEDQKRTWYLYHAIGESMRGRAPRTLGMPQGVAEKLKEQPAVIARRRPAPRTIARVAMAAAASVATVGVVGWLGTQGGSPTAEPVIAKSATSIRPVAGTATVAPAPALNVQEYLVAHRQVPSAEFYRPVTNRAPVPAR